MIKLILMIQQRLSLLIVNGKVSVKIYKIKQNVLIVIVILNVKIDKLKILIKKVHKKLINCKLFGELIIILEKILLI